MYIIITFSFWKKILVHLTVNSKCKISTVQYFCVQHTFRTNICRHTTLFLCLWNKHVCALFPCVFCFDLFLSLHPQPNFHTFPLKVSFSSLFCAHRVFYSDGGTDKLPQQTESSLCTIDGPHLFIVEMNLRPSQTRHCSEYKLSVSDARHFFHFPLMEHVSKEWLRLVNPRHPDSSACVCNVRVGLGRAMVFVEKRENSTNRSLSTC